VRRRAAALASLALVLGARQALAEPMFLSKQYNRCTTCHYSPTGGGLLTPYGRSLSRQELSTTGRSPSGTAPGAHGEEAFLWGALGDALGPVSLGIDLRPSHLRVDFAGGGTSRDFFMTADILAAWRSHGFTVYGELGRQPLVQGSKIASYEYWVSHESENGFGVRVGRFLPAYGVRLADHTAFTRAYLGFNYYDQVYALEVSQSGKSHLLQVSVGPGYADSAADGTSRQSFTAAGRFQWDLQARSSLVFSGLYRGKSDFQPSNGAAGVAYGIAPTSHLSIWSEGDVQFQEGSPGATPYASGPGTTTAYTLLNETSLEVYRGIWLKVSPQLRTDYGNTSGGVLRMAFGAALLPRTHWNVEISYYYDRTRVNDFVVKTFLAQLHMYI